MPPPFKPFLCLFLETFIHKGPLLLQVSPR
jgi:hypothetical protein